MTACLCVVGAVRPHPRETVSGDAWAYRCDGGTFRIALADGAGHGVLAAEAALTAIQVFEDEPTLSPEEILARCHTALRGTRGAVMTVAHIEAATRTLTLAGVGNIEALLVAGGREKHLIVQRGILGSNIPRVRSTVVELGDEWTLALHSDGIRSRFTLKDQPLPPRSLEEAQAIANALLDQYARLDDDASLVIAAPSCPSHD